MRVRNVKDKDKILLEASNVISNYQDYCGKWSSVFKNNNPIYLEIGPGKCKHLYLQAKANPNINYIGLEQNASIVAIALSKMEEKLDNLILINANAKDLDTIFNHEIDLLFLNFSDPWPKKRHAKRRLTSDVFLKVYDGLFTGIPHIIMKTDNDNLFAYSLESLKEYGYTLDRVEYDLHKTDISNVETEYEHKFSSKGVNIKFLDAKKYSRDI